MALTQAQLATKPAYQQQGNESLCPLAYSGDPVAEEVLKDRGNTVVDEFTLAKTLKGSQLYGYPTIDKDDVVVIHNGKVVTVNGHPYP